MKYQQTGLIVTLVILLLSAAMTSKAAEAWHWVKWTDDLFNEAKASVRFVLLDLEAVWCHWCHVMDKTPVAMSKCKTPDRQVHHCPG